MEPIYYIGAIIATGCSGEYARKCCKCKKPVFYCDDDKKIIAKNGHYICMPCVKQLVAGTKPNIIVRKSTIENLSKEWGVSLTMKDVKAIAEFALNEHGTAG